MRFKSVLFSSLITLASFGTAQANANGTSVYTFLNGTRLTFHAAGQLTGVYASDPQRGQKLLVAGQPKQIPAADANGNFWTDEKAGVSFIGFTPYERRNLYRRFVYGVVNDRFVVFTDQGKAYFLASDTKRVRRREFGLDWHTKHFDYLGTQYILVHLPYQDGGGEYYLLREDGRVLKLGQGKSKEFYYSIRNGRLRVHGVRGKTELAEFGLLADQQAQTPSVFLTTGENVYHFDFENGARLSFLRGSEREGVYLNGNNREWTRLVSGTPLGVPVPHDKLDLAAEYEDASGVQSIFFRRGAKRSLVFGVVSNQFYVFYPSGEYLRLQADPAQLVGRELRWEAREVPYQDKKHLLARLTYVDSEGNGGLGRVYLVSEGGEQVYLGETSSALIPEIDGRYLSLPEVERVVDLENLALEEHGEESDLAELDSPFVFVNGTRLVFRLGAGEGVYRQGSEGLVPIKLGKMSQYPTRGEGRGLKYSVTRALRGHLYEHFVYAIIDNEFWILSDNPNQRHLRLPAGVFSRRSDGSWNASPVALSGSGQQYLVVQSPSQETFLINRYGEFIKVVENGEVDWARGVLDPRDLSNDPALDDFLGLRQDQVPENDRSELFYHFGNGAVLGVITGTQEDAGAYFRPAKGRFQRIATGQVTVAPRALVAGNYRSVFGVQTYAVDQGGYQAGFSDLAYVVVNRRVWVVTAGGKNFRLPANYQAVQTDLKSIRAQSFLFEGYKYLVLKLWQSRGAETHIIRSDGKHTRGQSRRQEVLFSIDEGILTIDGMNRAYDLARFDLECLHYGGAVAADASGLKGRFVNLDEKLPYEHPDSVDLEPVNGDLRAFIPRTWELYWISPLAPANEGRGTIAELTHRASLLMDHDRAQPSLWLMKKNDGSYTLLGTPLARELFAQGAYDQSAYEYVSRLSKNAWTKPDVLVFLSEHLSQHEIRGLELSDLEELFKLVEDKAGKHPQTELDLLQNWVQAQGQSEIDAQAFLDEARRLAELWVDAPSEPRLETVLRIERASNKK